MNDEVKAKRERLAKSLRVCFEAVPGMFNRGDIEECVDLGLVEDVGEGKKVLTAKGRIFLEEHKK